MDNFEHALQACWIGDDSVVILKSLGWEINEHLKLEIIRSG